MFITEDGDKISIKVTKRLNYSQVTKNNVRDNYFWETVFKVNCNYKWFLWLFS